MTETARFAGLTPLLAPRSIAILGASNDATRIGGRPLAYMKLSGFKGAVYPVNPNRTEVQGVRAYPSVADLPEAPDVAIVAVPAGIAVTAVEELGRKGAKAALVFTAGFAEVDAAGEAAQARMVAHARAHGMRVLGPNCLGVFNGRTGTTPPSPARSTAAGRCRGGSASPASPVPTARIFTRWRAIAGSARRCAS